MSDKPSYLGLLNAIAVGEGRGYELLDAWAGKTGNRNLAEVLTVVAIREQEHAAAFTKRICELGYQVRRKANERFEENLALARSDKSDRKKFEKILGYGDSSQADDDPLGKLFEDQSIDPQTGSLLGRFIAEERDSGRRLRAAYEQLKAPPEEDDPMLREIAERLDRLSATLEELKLLRR